MKRIAVYGLGLGLLCALSLGMAVAPKLESMRIGVTQIVAHPILDAVKEGFTEEMKSQLAKRGRKVEFDVQIAQGDMTIARTIAQKFVTDKNDLIFTISTPSTQAAVKATKDIPIIFGAVTDPLGAGVVASLEKPEGNVTGISDIVSVEEQFDLLLEAKPTIKKIAWIYNPGEANARFAQGLIERAAQEKGLVLKTAPVANSSEVYVAAKSLVSQVDAFYVAIDNTSASAFDSILKVAEEAKLPVLSSDSGLVEKGALLTKGADYKDIGRRSAQMAAAVLAGKKPSELPVQLAQGTEIWVNKRAASRIGLVIPDSLLKKAFKVLE